MIARAAAALLLVAATDAVAAPRPDPTCDFPAQRTARIVVCEHTTGVQGMEPMLAVNRRGTLFMGMATDKGLYEQPGELTGTAENALLRSRNDGRTWKRIPLPGGINASEGFPYVDPHSGRLFVTSVSADTTRCGQPVIHSDDGGAHWAEAVDRPGCSPRTAGDWPKIFAGPHAVYVCNFIPNILVAASIGCWRSDDGGDHFAFAGLLPTVNGACRAGDQQGGTGATIVHGSGRVLSDGTVVVPLTVCGEPMVVRSEDKGQTWTAVSTGDDSLGLDDIASRNEGFVLGVTDHVWSENLAVDRRGDLFFAYLADGGVRLSTSRDGGRTWRRAGFISPPGIRRAIVVSVTARRRGEIALSYYGTADKGDAFGASGMNWRAWMSYSRHALAARPTFHSAPTSPPSKPTMGADMYGCCTTAQTFLEYTGVQFTGRREIRGAFTRWTGKHLPELVLGKLRLRVARGSPRGPSRGPTPRSAREATARGGAGARCACPAPAARGRPWPRSGAAG